MTRSRVRWQIKLFIRKWLPTFFLIFIYENDYTLGTLPTEWSNQVNEYVVHIILFFFTFFAPIKVYRLFWHLCESWIRWKRLWNTNLISLNYKMSLEQLWKKKLKFLFLDIYLLAKLTKHTDTVKKKSVKRQKCWAMWIVEHGLCLIQFVILPDFVTLWFL